MKQKLLKTMLLLCTLVGGGVSSVWADDVTATLTGSSIITGSSTSYSDYTSSGVTDDDDNVWYGRWCYQKSGQDMLEMIQLRTYTNGTDDGNCSRLNVPTFSGTIKTITLNITNTSATAYSTGTGCTTTMYLCTAYSKSSLTTVQEQSSASNRKTVTFDLTEEATDYTGEGLYICANGGVRIWSVAVTYSATAPSTCAKPSFSPAAGAVPSGQQITISCLTAGATIYYTTNGSDPTTSSSVYDPESKPTVTSPTTIKAYAVKDGLTDSEVATAAYTIAQVAAPTFSPGAGEVIKDSEITISCATDGATIYYTTDGTTPTTGSTEYDPDSKPTIDDDKTIKAIAIKANYLNSDVSEAAYTYSRQKDYNLVTSLSQIVSGKHYLIASGTSGSGVKVMDGQNDNNRGVKSVSFSGSTLQATGAQEFVIQGPDKDGYYTFYDASLEGFLYASSSSKNYLKTQTTLNDNGRFTITFSENAAVITAQGTNTHNLMRYNSSNSIFSCYESGQSAIYLFVLDGEGSPTESVTVTSVGYATYASDNALDFTGKSIEAYYATKNGTNGVNFTRIYKVPAREGVLLHNPSGATTTLDIPVATAKDAVTNNVFKRGTGATVASVSGDLHNYILNNKGGVIGFYRAAGQTVAKNRAYIQIDESAGVKEFIALPGSEETAVEAVKAEAVDGVIFNLAGQRVQKLQRGINIVNGKKVVVK